MGYKAGTLELEVLGMNDSTAISIEKTAKALNSLNRALVRMKGVSYGAQANKIANMFNKLAVATNAIDSKTLENLASVAKSLSAVSRLSRLEKMDFDKVGKGFQNLSVAMTPFVNKVKEAETSLVALDGILKRSTGKKIQGLLGGDKNKGLGTFAKLGVSTYMLRRLGRYSASLVKAGSDYYETLNLWQVAMRGNNDLADEFVNKMNKAYGISTQTLMNAQAIFRNMLGSLGQIPDEAAYKISEALVQMSADFSSLYNVKIEEAFSKMQSMLAGQVRPIRSAGLDMTETTLFMFYQQLGGTKTMRQLNRTEKQLLSILAVYKQMGRAGALGDMSKTLDQWANQTRMMTEYYTELKSWSGLLLKDLFESTGLLVYINALLITTTNVIKAIAKSRGVGEKNFLEGMFETTEATNDAIDELQGKLLDFDKFRSLEDTQASPLAIDEKLLEAISGYSSEIDKAQNRALELAESWTKFWVSDSGELTGNAEALLDILQLVAGVLAVIIGYKLVLGIVAIGKALLSVNPNVLILGTALAILYSGTKDFMGIWNDLTPLERVLNIITAMTAGIIGLYIATKAFSLSPVGAIAVGMALAGGVLALNTAFKKGQISFFAGGASDIDSGTMFVAGEMGKTEAVYTGSNGKTNVANIQQMKSAYTQSLNEWWSHAKHDIPAFQGVSDSGIYTIVDDEAKRRGKTFSNVR